MESIRCIFCGRPLNDGIIIFERKICKECLLNIQTALPNSLYYDYYVNSIRREITKEILKGEKLIG